MANRGRPRVYAHFGVMLKLPKGATTTDARHYVEDALKNWHGALANDGDVMFHLDPDTVEVWSIRKDKGEEEVNENPPSLLSRMMQVLRTNR